MARETAYSEAEVRAAVAAASCLTDALRRLGLRPAGGNFGTLRRLIDRFGLSTAHFDLRQARRNNYTAPMIPIEEILVEHSTYSRKSLKRRLYELGLKRRECELCGQGEMWRGARMGLILDHINGVPDDNRLENLRIVCPNCAATFETHCARNWRRPRVERTCERCGEAFITSRIEQRFCSRYCGTRAPRSGPRPRARKVERPPYAQLKAELTASSYCAVARRYGVTDNAVRKWMRAYEQALESDASGREGGGTKRA